MPRVPRALALTALLLPPAAHAEAPYRLPWSHGMAMELTQDCNDSNYNDHVGSRAQAWDFANGTHFPILAARGGVVAHLKISSNRGCPTRDCVDDANYIVIQHEDGTSSIYLHLQGRSLGPHVTCGAQVTQGELLGLAGQTGWATGPHLHFQVNAARPYAQSTCECGADGLGCAANESAWESFWSTPSYPSVPIQFDEWPASACGDRRMTMPVSRNRENVSRRARSTTQRPPRVRGEGASSMQRDADSHDGEKHRRVRFVPIRGRR